MFYLIIWYATGLILCNLWMFLDNEYYLNDFVSCYLFSLLLGILGPLWIPCIVAHYVKSLTSGRE
jgi:hypothetical protein